MPSCTAGPTQRMESPPGASILTMSAPRSPRICVADGPMMTVVRSSTRTPCSGPRGAVSFSIAIWAHVGSGIR